MDKGFPSSVRSRVKGEVSLSDIPISHKLVRREDLPTQLNQKQSRVNSYGKNTYELLEKVYRNAERVNQRLSTITIGDVGQ
jgi:hypothetical protein